MPDLTRFTESARLLESDASKRTVRLDIIEAGMGNARDRRVYPAEVLSRDAQVFTGAQMFGDHEDEEQERRRKGRPRSMWDVVGRITESWWNPTGGRNGRGAVEANAIIANSRAWDLIEHDPELLGVSINALGPTRQGAGPDGKPAHLVEGIRQCLSVDWVSRAGAGGRVTALTESDAEEGGVDWENLTAEDWAKLTPEMLAKHAPSVIEGVEERFYTELIAATEDDERERPPTTDDPKDDDDENDAESQDEEKDGEDAKEPEGELVGAAKEGYITVAQFKAAMKQMQEAHQSELRKRDNRRLVDEVLMESGLAARSVKALREEFFDADDEPEDVRKALQTAIREKKAEIAQYERRGVTGLGRAVRSSKMEESDAPSVHRYSAHEQLMSDMGLAQGKE